MLQLPDLPNRPGLLVSVRDVSEALDALAGGADVIDVKEPSLGSLGPASSETLADIIRAVDGRAPVTVALGELVDLMRGGPLPMPPGVSLFKIGLAGCSDIPDWAAQWRHVIASIIPREDAAERAVAVVYADWRTANAPPPQEVLRLAAEAACPALLVDTWDKSQGPVFDHWPVQELQRFIQSVHEHKLLFVLAGSLDGETFATAARLRPNLLAVRSAACDSGRVGKVSQSRVTNLRNAIKAATATQPPSLTKAN